MYKLTLFLALVFALSGGFVAGYSVANYPISGTTNIDVAVVVDNNQPLLQKQEEPPASSVKAKKDISAIPMPKVAAINDEALPGIAEAESFQQSLNRLLNIKSLTAGMEAQDLYASLKQVAMQQPELVVEHMDILLAEPVNSREFHLLASLLRNIPQPERQNALLNVVQQMDVFGDDEEQEKLISLLQYVEPQEIPAYIIENLVSLASSSPDTDSNLKLEALSLLNPSQIDDSARQVLAQSLIDSMQNASDSEIESLFVQSLRFATMAQRRDIAIEFLRTPENITLQRLVMDNMTPGVIPRNHEVLYLIEQVAQNKEHPNHELAAEVLWLR